MTAQIQPMEPDAGALSATVSDNIAAEAGRRRLTQGQLAAGLGMGRQSVQARYTGRTPWTLDEVQRAARFFGVRPADLLLELPRLDSNQQPSGYRARGHLRPVA